MFVSCMSSVGMLVCSSSGVYRGVHCVTTPTGSLTLRSISQMGV